MGTWKSYASGLIQYEVRDDFCNLPDTLGYAWYCTSDHEADGVWFFDGLWYAYNFESEWPTLVSRHGFQKLGDAQEAVLRSLGLLEPKRPSTAGAFKRQMDALKAHR